MLAKARADQNVASDKAKALMAKAKAEAEARKLHDEEEARVAAQRDEANAIRRGEVPMAAGGAGGWGRPGPAGMDMAGPSQADMSDRWRSAGGGFSAASARTDERPEHLRRLGGLRRDGPPRGDAGVRPAAGAAPPSTGAYVPPSMRGGGGAAPNRGNLSRAWGDS